MDAAIAAHLVQGYDLESLVEAAPSEPTVDPGSVQRMSDLTLVPVSPGSRLVFVEQIQEAFQVGLEGLYGPSPETILPTEDVEKSFAAPGAEAYFAMSGETVLGGAIIVVQREDARGHLDLLYVRVGSQGRGTGQAIWQAVERMHPEVSVWETHTPYFEKRNIHFYVNTLGFHIVEFYHQAHPDPHHDAERVGGLSREVGSEFFRFEKRIR